MSTARPIELTGFWTDWTVMNMDKGIHGVGLEDGYLHLEEISQYLQDVGKMREKRVAAGKTTTYLDMQLDDGRKLYTDMLNNDITTLKYLPDAVLQLESGVRQRACELLRLDDPMSTGEVDQYSIDHARARVNEINPTSSAGLLAKNSALTEIGKLAYALGLN